MEVCKSGGVKVPVLQLNGLPITAPSMARCDLLDSKDRNAGGAPHVCIGDVVNIPVVLDSHLPQPLNVTQCQLVLTVLQVFSSTVEATCGSLFAAALPRQTRS